MLFLILGHIYAQRSKLRLKLIRIIDLNPIIVALKWIFFKLLLWNLCQKSKIEPKILVQDRLI